MSTAADVQTLLRGLLAAGTALPIRWRGDDTDSSGEGALPDVPSSFLFCDFETDPATIAGFGGGRGANLYRTTGRLDVFIFVPRGDGADGVALGHAEDVAAIFRSYRDATLSCFAGSVLSGKAVGELRPPGMASEVNAYSYAIAEIELWYDQVG